MSIVQKISLTAFIIFSPLLALGAIEGGDGDLEKFGADIVNFINNTLVPFVFAIALLLFIYGAYLYFIQGGGEDESRKNGNLPPQQNLWVISGSGRSPSACKRATSAALKGRCQTVSTHRFGRRPKNIEKRLDRFRTAKCVAGPSCLETVLTFAL